MIQKMKDGLLPTQRKRFHSLLRSAVMISLVILSGICISWAQTGGQGALEGTVRRFRWCRYSTCNHYGHESGFWYSLDSYHIVSRCL